jgi:hypothetical protein
MPRYVLSLQTAASVARSCVQTRGTKQLGRATLDEFKNYINVSFKTFQVVEKLFWNFYTKAWRLSGDESNRGRETTLIATDKNRGSVRFRA